MSPLLTINFKLSRNRPLLDCDFLVFGYLLNRPVFIISLTIVKLYIVRLRHYLMKYGIEIFVRVFTLV